MRQAEGRDGYCPRILEWHWWMHSHTRAMRPLTARPADQLTTHATSKCPRCLDSLIEEAAATGICSMVCPCMQVLSQTRPFSLQLLQGLGVGVGKLGVEFGKSGVGDQPTLITLNPQAPTASTYYTLPYPPGPSPAHVPAWLPPACTQPPLNCTLEQTTQHTIHDVYRKSNQSSCTQLSHSQSSRSVSGQQLTCVGMCVEC